ncbi:MAG: bifunctional folylpolyglutamate synthase/dihydrofolate synthase [Opitutales bacterium]
MPCYKVPSYKETRDYLYSLRDRGSKYGIERMQRFVAELGHPERRFPVIHVAGTNGKGSVCAMLEAIYRANGYRTGLYTSPHLVHLGERVQVDRLPLTETDIVRHCERLRPVAAALGAGKPEEHPSFFEFMTAMAFLQFADAQVDLAILETGLGGRLDATNVAAPELSVITSVSLDHTELLGDSLAKIAREKAGICKPRKPVLLGRLPPEAEAVVREVAAERGCPVHTVGDRFRDPAQLPQTNLAGQFQRWNAGLAIHATELLAERFPVRATDALRSVDWAGRWQRIELGDRSLILDATHNPEGCAVLEENLRDLRDREGRKPVVLAGTLGEDRARSLMPVIARHAREIHLVRPDQPRACETPFLESCLPGGHGIPVRHSSVAEAFPAPSHCALGESGDTIVVTGSIYLLGEVLQRLDGAPNTGGRLQDTV